MRYLRFALVVLGIGTGLVRAEGARIEGIAVNGTQNDKPLAGTDVVLRGGEEGALQIVAQAVTDQSGRFVFDKLSTAPGLIFLPGVNHQGIHYPGSKLRLSGASSPAFVKLIAFDAVAAPNPLVADLHKIDIEIQESALKVTETLTVNNPSLTTYVGQPESGTPLTTLSLLIPDGFERVTFNNEFNGRHFKLHDKRLMTDVPWTPGKREVKFTYHLPSEDAKGPLAWSVDVPCTQYRLCVRGTNAEQFASNLSRIGGPDQSAIVFESKEGSIPAGHIVRLQPASPRPSLIVYVRWFALPVLAGLIFVTAGFRIGRRALPKQTIAS